jgi:hypothetical protein
MVKRVGFSQSFFYDHSKSLCLKKLILNLSNQPSISEYGSAHRISVLKEKRWETVVYGGADQRLQGILYSSPKVLN